MEHLLLLLSTIIDTDSTCPIGMVENTSAAAAASEPLTINECYHLIDEIVNNPRSLDALRKFYLTAPKPTPIDNESANQNVIYLQDFDKIPANNSVPTASHNRLRAVQVPRVRTGQLDEAIDTIIQHTQQLENSANQLTWRNQQQHSQSNKRSSNNSNKLSQRDQLSLDAMPKKDLELFILKQALNLQYDERWKKGGKHSRLPAETLSSLAILIEEVIFHLLRPVFKKSNLLVPVIRSEAHSSGKQINNETIGFRGKKYSNRYASDEESPEQAAASESEAATKTASSEGGVQLEVTEERLELEEAKSAKPLESVKLVERRLQGRRSSRRSFERAPEAFAEEQDEQIAASKGEQRVEVTEPVESTQIEEAEEVEAEEVQYVEENISEVSEIFQAAAADSPMSEAEEETIEEFTQQLSSQPEQIETTQEISQQLPAQSSITSSPQNIAPTRKSLAPILEPIKSARSILFSPPLQPLSQPAERAQRSKPISSQLQPRQTRSSTRSATKSKPQIIITDEEKGAQSGETNNKAQNVSILNSSPLQQSQDLIARRKRHYSRRTQSLSDKDNDGNEAVNGEQQEIESRPAKRTRSNNRRLRTIAGAGHEEEEVQQSILPLQTALPISPLLLPQPVDVSNMSNNNNNNNNNNIMRYSTTPRIAGVTVNEHSAVDDSSVAQVIQRSLELDKQLEDLLK
jgi:hypothetical protein